jgi:hypothetical protein
VAIVPAAQLQAALGADAVLSVEQVVMLQPAELAGLTNLAVW